jgi:deoxyribodipyrimidine photolyase-related protein
MTTLRLIMGDHLTTDIASLRGADKKNDIVLMVELASEIEPVPHHKQKIVLILSAMRHFSEALKVQGFHVDYVELDDAKNSQNFTGEVQRAIARHGATRLIVTEPSEWRVMNEVNQWASKMGVSVEIQKDDRFICTQASFNQWAAGRKSLRMEYFYRQMRNVTGLLMEGRDPVGGLWNYDQENRKAIPSGLRVPAHKRFKPDKITENVIALVEKRFPSHFGRIEEFGWAVTRRDALEVLEDFILNRLAHFGDYQDAMRGDDPFLFHSLLSPYLNIGLLKPMEVCIAAEEAWKQGRAPLNATEGFIRQIIGWREYVRGIYWLKMPDYADTNALCAQRPLPEFYWTGRTDMACLSGSIRQVIDHGYGHHIQRLMVTGNFALLAGISPKEVERWYLAVFVDAFEWVELPNTHGMALFADGGLLASKPYAASGAYINRMSDYCKKCRFSPSIKDGDDACPFNYLYWNFLISNQALLKSNPRMAIIYRSLATMPEQRRENIKRQSDAFFKTLNH